MWRSRCTKMALSLCPPRHEATVVTSVLALAATTMTDR